MQLLWLYPLLGLSFFCAGIAHADLANSGNTHNSSQGHSSKSSNKLLDNISRALVIVQCFVVGFLLYRIPLLGRFACFVCVVSVL